MQTLTNPKPIEEIADLLPTIKDKIEKTTNEMKEYLNSLKDEKYEEKKDEEIDNQIKRAESIYDRLDESVRRRIFVLNNGKETIELINEVKLKIENVVESCGKDGILLEKANDELIDIIIDLEDRKRIKDIKPLQLQIDDINNTFNIKKNEWESNLTKRKKEEEERKRKEEELRKRKEKELRKQEEEKLKRMNTIIDINEMKQIEEWSGRKIGNIIFDSNVDNWNINTSVFDQKVLNKSNLIFIIEDDEDNKFGSYMNAKIDNVGQRWINDPKSFVFSLKSNGRLNGMLKFDITQSQNAFSLYNQSYEYLFVIGYGGLYGDDIRIYKENNKNYSYCNQRSFNYNGIENALCGKYNFTPKRITVIQLI